MILELLKLKGLDSGRAVAPPGLKTEAQESDEEKLDSEGRAMRGRRSARRPSSRASDVTCSSR